MSWLSQFRALFGRWFRAEINVWLGDWLGQIGNGLGDDYMLIYLPRFTSKSVLQK